jgi:hypothetical protein
MTNRLYSSAFALMVVVAWAEARACEDEHPPVESTPVEEFIVGGVAEDERVRLGFDPRGLGLVVPAGDDADRWVKSEDDAGAWHYREWQWWKGHPWGESCRPRYYSEVEFKRLRNNQHGVLISYQIDGFDCRQTFCVPKTLDGDEPYWDVVTTVRNEFDRDVEEYGQFFACYTQTNRDRSFWYWDASGELVRFADRGVGHLDGYIAHPSAYFLKDGAVPHCPRGGGRIVGQWHKPVMISQASPAGWRSIVLVEAAFAAALTQGIQGKAMDYIVFPSAKRRMFANGDEFSVHIRQVMLKSPKLPSKRQLEEMWSEFEGDHIAIKNLAARS